MAATIRKSSNENEQTANRWWKKESARVARRVAKLTRLLKVLERAVEPTPRKLMRSLENLPSRPKLPSPDETWDFIQEFQRNEDEQWARELVMDHLLDLCGDIESEGVVEGRVPDMPGWYFELTNDGDVFCILTHRSSGKEIEVDLSDLIQNDESECSEEDDDQEQPIDDPQIPRLFISSSYISIGGATIEVQTSVEQIDKEVLSHRHAILAFAEGWEDQERRVWLAALIGDWSSAHEAAKALKDPELIAVTRKPAKRCIKTRLRAARKELKSTWCEPKALETLLELGAKDLPRLLCNLLEQDPNPNPDALIFILQKDLPGYEFEVYRRRLSVGPNLRSECAQYLAKRNYRLQQVIVDLVERVRESGWSCFRAAFLAIKYRPGLSKGLFRKLFFHTENCYFTWGIDVRKSVEMIALPLILDPPWRKAVLREALGKLEDPVVADCCRLALGDRKLKGRSQGIVVLDDAGPQRSYLGTVEEFLEGEVERVRLELKDFQR